MSARDAELWLRHLKMTVPKLLAARRAKLLDHFEKQVPGYVVYS